MQKQPAALGMPSNILFALKDISFSPTTPRLNEAFTVKGKVQLFGISFLAPVWVIVTVTYPEKWWEEIIPIIGSPEVRETDMAIGGNFEIAFTKGFDREGEYKLAVRLYPGPTMSLNAVTLPPFPAIATVETTFTVAGEVPPAEEVSFSLTRPSVSPATTVEPGTAIKISCPVTSECGKEQTITVKCIIYEGSILPGHGTKLAEYSSAATTIAPGETKTFDFSRTTVAGTIDRRDVQVEVYIAGKLVKESEWDDVYYVGQPPAETIDFDLAQPSVLPATTVSPGTKITITCPVTSACTKQQTATAKVIIYEGSLLPGHGALIATYTSPSFTIDPGQTYNITVSHTTVVGTIDRRDIEVEIYIGGKLVKENEWDDVYYVKAEVEPAKGAISKKELEYDETRGAIPVSNVTQGKSGLVHIWGRNSTSAARQLGISWEVRDPDGYVIESYSTWELWPYTGAGKEKEFIGGRFGLSKVGTYKISVTLRMNSGSPADIDKYDGTLCTVIAPAGVIAFELGQPLINNVVQPTNITLGQSITIVCPITSRCDASQQITVRVRVDEGSFWPTPGSMIEEFSAGPFTIAPNQTQNVTINTTAKGATDRKDIEVWVYVGGVEKAYNHFDDAFWVTSGGVGYTLTLSVASPAVGWVGKSPDKATYSQGEVVTLTAYLDNWAIGYYAFDHWTVDGVTKTGNPITITMDGNKSVACYFRAI